MKRKKFFIIGLLILLIFTVIFFLHRYFKQENLNANNTKYELYKVIQEPDLNLRGKVFPLNIQVENYNLINGQIVEVNFKDEQEISKGEKLITYLNTENKNHLEKTKREIKKLSDDKKRLLDDEEKLIEEIEILDEKISDLELKIEKKEKKSYEEDKDILETIDNVNSFDASAYTMEMNNLIAKKETLISNKKSTLLSIQELDYRIDELEHEIENKTDSYEQTIKAEFDGVIQKFISDSNTVPNDGIIFRLLSNQKKIVSKVSEFDYDILRIGKSVDISLISSSQKLKGSIAKISTIPLNKEMNSEISEYGVEINTEDNINYGSTVKLTIKNEKIYVPISSVKKEGKDYYVYKYLNKKVKKVTVKGNVTGELFEIKSGIIPGDSIILNYDKDLVDNEQIEVKND